MATLRILIFITLGLSLDSSQVKAIDGGYSDWVECADCSVTCGGGTKVRARTCTNPPPSNGGKDCSELGPAYKIDSCNNQDCPPPCKPALNIGLILDKSSSIGSKSLENAVALLRALIGKFNPAPDADHIAFITFWGDFQLVFSFADSKYYNKDTLLEKINNVTIDTKRGSKANRALNKAGELFTLAKEDRPDVPNVLILFTDGRLKEDVLKKTVEAARDLEGNHVYMVAVGIGKRMLVKDNLQNIVGDGYPVVLVEENDDVEEQADTIKSKACFD